MANWKEKYRNFRNWQRQPAQAPPFSDRQTDCLSCNTRYRGNYCPRCGQSADVERISIKKAGLMFLNQWGLGNRSIFRTIRDLVLRPGYLIRDYLKGIQVPYYPPVKLLFLLTALSIFVAYGMNLQRRQYKTEEREKLQVVLEQQRQEAQEEPEFQIIQDTLAGGLYWLLDAQDNFPNIVSLTSIVLLTLILYFFFRKTPEFPHLRLSEFFIAMIYCANMTTLYDITLNFLGIDSDIVKYTAVFMVIPLKQLSGFSWFRVILYLGISLLLIWLAMVVILTAFILIAHYC